MAALALWCFDNCLTAASDVIFTLSVVCRNSSVLEKGTLGDYNVNIDYDVYCAKTVSMIANHRYWIVNIIRNVIATYIYLEYSFSQRTFICSCLIMCYVNMTYSFSDQSLVLYRLCCFINMSDFINKSFIFEVWLGKKSVVTRFILKVKLSATFAEIYGTIMYPCCLSNNLMFVFLLVFYVCF